MGLEGRPAGAGACRQGRGPVYRGGAVGFGPRPRPAPAGRPRPLREGGCRGGRGGQVTRPASQDGGDGGARNAAAASRLLRRASRGWQRTVPHLVLFQDTGVGKSSIVWRFVEDSFDPNINPTIGASFMTKTVQYQNELHKFLIWDTAGQERFRALAPMYYRGSAAAIIVYDITKEETFSTLKNWVKELRQHGPPNIVVAIAGNKCDLIDVREVMERDAKDYADSIHAIFVETSAKNAININELFIEISRRIPSTDANPPSGGKGFKLRRQPSEPKRSCC
uniref:RAB22A, member RAS onco family n=1 Tax=Nomascus leucogenys TaxID=61853 RepID=G1RDS6_NOMLE